MVVILIIVTKLPQNEGFRIRGGASGVPIGLQSEGFAAVIFGPGDSSP